MGKKLLLMTLLMAGAMFANAQSITKTVPKTQMNVTNTRTVQSFDKKKITQVVAENKAETKAAALATQREQNVKILSSKVVGQGIELQVVKDKAGIISKRISGNKPQHDKILERNTFAVKAESRSIADNTFFESFEEYDGETFDWIPAGWSEKNADGNIAEVGYNNTWCVSVGSPYFTMPSDGDYMAYVHFSYDDADKGKTAIAQDEWLITPSITPKTNDKLYFDLGYCPFFLYNMDYVDWAGGKFTKREISTTMKVMISVDGGEWKQLWDAGDETEKLTDDELWNADQVVFTTYSINLSDYVGKSIKIAFRYVGFDGDSMAVDAVRVGAPSPTALYQRPDGYFFWGLTEDFSGISNNYLFGPAYENAQWYNYSGKDSESFNWSFLDPTLETDNSLDFTDIEPVVNYVWGNGIPAPVLTASAAGARDSVYQWNGYMSVGGNSSVRIQGETEPLLLGVGNYDIDLKLTSPFFDDDKYCFGTNSDDIWGMELDAIANYFEKPLHKYFFDKLWINLMAFDADADAEFTLTIRRVTDAGLADTIATSVAYASDLIKTDVGDGEVWSSLPFKFTDIDPETGREEEVYLEVEDAIFVELKGFKDSKVRTFAPMTQAKNSPTYESNIYAYFNVKDEKGKVSRVLSNGADLLNDFYSSFMFNMNITYSFIFADENEYVAPVEGGEKEFKITSLYTPQGWWTDEDIPEGLEITPVEGSATESDMLKVKVSALPTGTTGRILDFTLKTFGAEQAFHITQGDVTGISTSKVNQVKAIRNGDSFELTYPEGVASVSVINAAGQLVANYNLSANGKYIMPAADLAKGLYILRFNGEKNAIIKILK